METLGCGVPIVGYRNRAFEGIMNLADVGWLVEDNDLDALAGQIAMLNAERETITAKAHAAVSLASQHCFETTFLSRVEHLHAVAFSAN